MLGLELHDHPADGRFQAATLGARGGRVGREEAQHAVPLEALDPAVKRALGGADLPGPLDHGGAEQGYRPELLVVLLLRPLEERDQELPVIGRLDSSAFAVAHLFPLAARPWDGKRMPQSHARGQFGPSTGRSGDRRSLPPAWRHPGATGFMS